jgi:hypothetical protein
VTAAFRFAYGCDKAKGEGAAAAKHHSIAIFDFFASLDSVHASS